VAIEGNYPEQTSRQWHNDSWAQNHDNALTHTFVVQQFLASTKTSHPHPPYSPDLTPWIFPIPKDETEAQGAMFWQHWRDPD
jgi:hypothetical protein